MSDRKLSVNNGRSSFRGDVVLPACGKSACINTENLIITFSSEFKNKIKGVTMTERQYLRVHVTEPKFYAKNSCCLLLAANCLESYRTHCVCLCARSSVLSVHASHDSAQDESVVTRNYLTW